MFTPLRKGQSSVVSSSLLYWKIARGIELVSPCEVLGNLSEARERVLNGRCRLMVHSSERGDVAQMFWIFRPRASHQGSVLWIRVVFPTDDIAHEWAVGSMWCSNDSCHVKPMGANSCFKNELCDRILCTKKYSSVQCNRRTTNRMTSAAHKKWQQS